MGVYINMEMPTKGYRLLLVHADGTVQTTDGETAAVPVPPHGRLIDADAAVANRNADMNWCYDLYDLPDYLSGCPTIIPPDPAEEGE